jgi:hypothetical protein
MGAGSLSSLPYGRIMTIVREEIAKLSTPVTSVFLSGIGGIHRNQLLRLLSLFGTPTYVAIFSNLGTDPKQTLYGSNAAISILLSDSLKVFPSTISFLFEGFQRTITASTRKPRPASGPNVELRSSRQSTDPGWRSAGHPQPPIPKGKPIRRPNEVCRNFLANRCRWGQDSRRQHPSSDPQTNLQTRTGPSIHPDRASRLSVTTTAACQPGKANHLKGCEFKDTASTSSHMGPKDDDVYNYTLRAFNLMMWFWVFRDAIRF